MPKSGTEPYTEILEASIACHDSDTVTLTPDVLESRDSNIKPYKNADWGKAEVV